MRRLRLPASFAEAIGWIALLGAAPASVGLIGALALHGDPGLSGFLLKMGCAGTAVMGACGVLALLEKAGRLVFVTPPEEAELVRDRQLRLEGPGAESLRDVPLALSKEPPRPLLAPAKVAFGGALACWGFSCWSAGLVLSLAALALYFSGELVRAWRVLRARDEDR